MDSAVVQQAVRVCYILGCNNPASNPNKSSPCKPCKKVQGALRYQKNKDKVRDNGKAYRAANQERIRKNKQDYFSNLDPLRKTYIRIMARCHQPNNPKYPTWGGRGIYVYGPWRESYEEFRDYVIKTIGDHPGKGRSLDRFPNNDEGYIPGNLRWGTDKEQQNNKRSNLAYRTSISDDSPIGYREQATFLKDFSEAEGIPLIIAKYRYSKHPIASWIIQDDYDGRNHEYQGHLYNTREISILLQKPYKLVHRRLHTLGWTVEKMLTPE